MTPLDPEKPLLGFRALFACPTYGNVDPHCAKHLRVAVMSAASKGLHWAGDISPDRLGYSFARNSVASMARRFPDEFDGVMWVDSDIVCNPDSIIRLLTTARTHSLDFVTGVYHSRKPPNLPILYHWESKIERYLQCVTYPKDTIISADACGFGFVWTSTRLINAIAEAPLFRPKEGWFPDRRDVGGFGEDISFGDHARHLEPRIQLYVDTGVQVGHLGDAEVIWEKQFRDRNLTIDSSEIQTRVVEANWGAKA